MNHERDPPEPLDCSFASVIVAVAFAWFLFMLSSDGPGIQIETHSHKSACLRSPTLQG